MSRTADLIVTGGNDGVPGDKDGTARLWNANTGEPVGPPLTHEDTIFGVDISPHGTRVVTDSADGTAQVGDTANGLRVGAAMTHDHRVLAVAFNSEGTTVLTGSHDTTPRMWNAETGDPIGLPLRHGKSLLIGCRDGGAHLFRVAPHVDGSPQQVRRWVEVITGRELDAQGGVRFLDPETRAERRQELERLGRPPVL